MRITIRSLAFPCAGPEALNPTLASEQWTDMRKGLRNRLRTIIRTRMRITMMIRMKLILRIILTDTLRSIVNLYQYAPLI